MKCRSPSPESKQLCGASNSKISAFVGYDYERFSSFNTEEVVDGNDLIVRDNQVHFFTAGVSKLFTIWDRYYFVKVSGSQSISATSTPASSISDEKLAGTRWQLYMNTKLTNSVLGHVIIKSHSLQGPTSLNIFRVGFGLGYRFF